jgi:hypothetical protein
VEGTIPRVITAITAVTNDPIIDSVRANKDGHATQITKDAGDIYRIGRSDTFGCRQCSVKYDWHFVVDYVCSCYSDQK